MKKTLEEKRAARAARKASEARIAESQAKVRAIVATGVCPHCSRGLRRNLSLAGWWQCEQFGAEGFRAESSLPACNWQGFTE